MDGVTPTVSGTATDNAANSAGASFGPVQVDKTKPAISITSPQANASYKNPVKLTIAWISSDGLSGIAYQSATLDGKPVTHGQVVDLFLQSLGSHTVVVTAADVAGNTNSASASFSVIVDAASLSASVTQALALGWIDNGGTANSLLSKLSGTPTRNQLNAFLNELNPQQGKHINQQAYTVLQAAALYLLSTLP